MTLNPVKNPNPVKNLAGYTILSYIIIYYFILSSNLAGWQSCRLACWQAGRMPDWQRPACWQVGKLAGLHPGRLAGQHDARLPGLHAGRLIGRRDDGIHISICVSIANIYVYIYIAKSMGIQHYPYNPVDPSPASLPACQPAR